MPSPEQDDSLRALVEGENPALITFDPITDNDTSQSCIGCLWSILGSASFFVALYVADHRLGWGQAEPWLRGWGLALLIAIGCAFALAIFTALELAVGNEVYVLDLKTKRLELHRKARGNTRLLKSWPREQLRRFLLEPPPEDGPVDGPACLYVLLSDGQQIRLLEACYSRVYVEQIEWRLAEICEVPSTTSS